MAGGRLSENDGVRKGPRKDTMLLMMIMTEMVRIAKVSIY